MHFKLLTRTGRVLALGLATWASLGTEAWAQAQPTIDSAKPSPLPTSVTLRAGKKVVATTAPTSLRTMPNAHLEESLQLLYQESTSLRNTGPVALRAALQASHPDLKFDNGSQAAPAVLVRITAQDVAALLPRLASRGFVVVASYPKLHFVEGTLPVSQLSGDGNGVEALAAQGLMGVLASYRPENHVGLVTSQADYVLEAARTRAYRRNGVSVSGAGVRIGVLSDSFNSLKGAATDVASGDLPAAGVQVLSDINGGTDEGRAMCQLIHDLAPDSPLAFSTAYNSEGDFAQHIRDLADATKGNCKVIVDDVAYFTEPYFQDGVIAQAVTDVVASGVSYFSSAGNGANASYENAAPQFVADSANPAKRVLNFDATGARTDTKQRIVLAAPTATVTAGNFRPFLQWSDPFYTTGGVRTNLDLYLIAVRNGVAGDTVARGRTNNIATNTPLETINFTNTAATGTTTFDLVIVLRGGVAPTRVKYINVGTTNPREWFGASTIVGHAAAAAASAVAAVRYFDQRVPESFTALGGAPPFLFSHTGVALATPELRQKPNMAAADGTDTSFFGGSDTEGSGFPNFFGTSAAAPHAAAVAALLRSAEPALTPAQVASRLAGTARLLGTTATDPLTGPGLVDAFTAVYGPPVAVAAPYIEDFEKAVLPTNWLVNSTRGGRVQVLNNDGPSSGKYQLLLDASVRYTATNAEQSLNEATCYLTNTAGGSLQLSFRQRRYPAETDELMPAQFTGSSATDGVALSVDGGTNWYRVFDLTGANSTTNYQTNIVNLTQFATANGLTLGADVRLRFQQYGGGGATGATVANRRGRVFDDIAITALNPGPVALLNAGPATTGCPGLQVQYADTSLFRPTAYAWTFPGGTPASSTMRNPLVTYNTPGHYAVTLSVSNAAGTSARTDTGFVFISGRAPQVTVTNTTPDICRGGTVTFGSTALYCPTSYLWSFPGGTPSSSTSPNPGAITYPTSGSYPATLVVSNAYGSVTSTIIVDVDGRTLPFAETFDNTATLPRGWTLVTPSTYSWTLADNIIGRSGVASRALQAPFADDTQVGEYPSVYTPAINLAGVTKPTLLFDVAYGPFATVAGAVSTDIDSLTIRIADACTGTILGRPYSKGTLNGLPTSASTPNYFVPTTASQWRQELVDLTPYAGKSIVIQFRGYNGFGNTLFLDNVQVGNSLLSLTSAASAVGLEAWPVPTPRGTSLNLRLPAYSGSVSLRLVDNLGRTVWQQQVQQNGAALQRTLALPFAPGLYNLLYSPAGGTPAARRVVLE